MCIGVNDAPPVEICARPVHEPGASVGDQGVPFPDARVAQPVSRWLVPLRAGQDGCFLTAVFIHWQSYSRDAATLRPGVWLTVKIVRTAIRTRLHKPNKTWRFLHC